jgi:hypothetical protein
MLNRKFSIFKKHRQIFNLAFYKRKNQKQNTTIWLRANPKVYRFLMPNLPYTKHCALFKMKEGYKFIRHLDGTERKIDWEELNQLKKDILWIYDENFGDIANAFVPPYSFNKNYWEFLTLNGDKWFYEDENSFYHIGSLMILLCCCSEYIDIPGGSIDVFKRDNLPVISEYIEQYQPRNEQEKLIKQKVLLGLNIAQSMSPENLLNNDFVDGRVSEYYDGLNELGNAIIKNYYEEKLKT